MKRLILSLLAVLQLLLAPSQAWASPPVPVAALASVAADVDRMDVAPADLGADVRAQRPGWSVHADASDALQKLSYFSVPLTGAGKVTGGSSGIAAPPPVTDQVAYWGPKTLVGNGGYTVAGLAPGAVQSAPDTANYYWDATNRWIVPKLGANKTYNLSRGGSPLPSSEVFTIVDSTGTTFTVDNRADVARAGHYTWRWRNGDSTGSTSGTIQLLRAWADSVYGDELVMRGGTTLNTTADCVTGCSVGSSTLFNGTAGFRFACNLGNCTSSAGFNGSNHRIIRSELGFTNTIGPISFEAAQLVGFKFVGFNIDGEAASYTGYLVATVLGSGSTPGPSDYIFDGLTITGSSTDPYGKNRPDGIALCMDCKGQILNSEIQYTRNGISTQHSLGTVGDVFAGSTAPNTGELVIRGNYLHDIGRDSLATQCPRYVTLEDNVFTDQRTEITVGSSAVVSGVTWVNPFDSQRQAHSDKVQLNFQNTGTNVCAWNYYPGIVVRNNYFARGQGFDALPFWSVANGFPNPNNYGGGSLDDGIPAQAWTPDPTVSAADSQGLFSSNFNFDCPAVGPGCTSISRKLVAGTTPRTYAATLDAPVIEQNTIVATYVAGISLPPIRNGSVVANSVINPRVATSTNLETWSGFGNAGVIIAGTEGSPTIARNHGNLSSSIGSTTSPPSGQIVELTIPNYGTAFNNPTGNLSPRTLSDYRQYYRPLVGGVLDLGGGAFAGATCPDGSANTGATCPLSFANDNAPARVSDGLWRWAA